MSNKELMQESIKSSGTFGAKPTHKVIAFGRMNPPTIGHEQVVNKVHEVAKEHGATHTVILSHSHDSKKNPLSPEQKVKHAKNGFPNTNIEAADKKSPTILHHAAKAHAAGAQHLHVVAGSDRVEEYKKLLNKYNGQHSAHGHYNFKSINVHSSGERDPDSEDKPENKKPETAEDKKKKEIQSISGSKMREHAASGNVKEFHKGAPSKMSTDHKNAMYKDVRKGLDINEAKLTYKDLVEAKMSGADKFRKHLSDLEKKRKEGEAERAKLPANERLKATIDALEKSVMRKEETELEEGVYTDDDSIAKELVKKHGKNVNINHVKDALQHHPEGHKTTSERVTHQVKRILSVKEEVELEEALHSDTWGAVGSDPDYKTARKYGSPTAAGLERIKKKKEAEKKETGLYKKQTPSQRAQYVKNQMAALKHIPEAHKIGDKVIIHKGPRDVIGKVGHIGEIRKPWVGAEPRYTIDHEGGSIQLMKHHIKKYKAEEVKEETIVESAPFKDLKSAVHYASEKVKTHRDHDDGIEVYKHKAGGYDVNHTMNANGRNALHGSGAKHLGTVYRDNKFNVHHNIKEEVEQVDEVLKPSMGAGEYVKDFQKSDAPQFKGKSKEKRRMMGIAAYLQAQREMQEARQFGSYEQAKAAAAPGQKPKLNPATNKYILVSEETIQEATVDTKKYSWGTMKTVHHGADFSIPLHPEHHQAIAKLKDEQEHHFKDETGRHWTARRKGDDVHFQGANGGNSTKVKHSTMSEEVEQIDELSINKLNQVHAAAVRDANDASREGDETKATKRYNLAGKASMKVQDKKKVSEESINEYSMDDLHKDAAARLKKDIDKASDDRIAAHKNPPKKKGFFAKVGEKQINMVKGAWHGLTKEEVELQEANHRDYACAGCMHPDMAKHMKTGEHMDYYEPKTGDKVHGKVMHNDGKEVHVKQTHDSYNPKKVGTVHKFKVTDKLDEELKQTGPVDTNKVNTAGDKAHEEKWEKAKKVKKESLSFADFINTLQEHQYSSGSYKHKGTYGSSHVEPDEDEDDKPAKPAAEKRGRGRPKGAASGARQVGSTASKRKSFADYTGYKLHLPNNNK